MISGTVTYLQRMALPPEAVIHLRLEDVPRQGAAARLLTEVAFPAAGRQVPIPFRIPYRQADIVATGRYQVRAAISLNGKLIFTSTVARPVITGNAPTEVAIMVQPAPARPANPTLAETSWTLIDIGGQPAVVGSDQKPAYLLLQTDGKKLAGSSGCNQVFGTYTLDGSRLRLNPAGLSMMMCPDTLMKQEKAFVAALKATTGYRIVGDRLELRDGDRVLARFRAANVR
jgi:putative lipoprotein